MNEGKIDPKTAVLLQVIMAFNQQRDEIGDSDLDDDQPITLFIRTRLGFMRKLNLERLRISGSDLLERSRELAEEIARLRRDKAALVELLNEWTQCAMYDAMMEGPRFKGFNRSSLKRCLVATRAALLSATEMKAPIETKGARNRPLPTTRCDCCDNGLDDDWDYCPFCGRHHPDATETKDGQS